MRLVLTVEAGHSQGGQEFVLEQGSLSLGREANCQVRFTDSQVSRHHAVVAYEGGSFRLKDQSSNGTSVNGAPVTSAVLRSGDQIQLGPEGPTLRVLIEGAAIVPAAVDPPAPKTARTRLSDTGLYNPTTDRGRRTSLLSITVVLGMSFLGAFLGLLVLLMTGFELGPAAAFVGTFAAFLPAPLYLAIWLWLDRYDPEPAWILAGCFLWGAGAATFVSSIANTLFTAAVRSATGNPQMAALLGASLSAPFVEEATKAVPLLLALIAFRREFDGVLDGIVYAGIVALGFATVENVLYYGRTVHKAGAAGLVVVFILRGVLGPFGHAVFTSMTGIGCGLARQSYNKFLRVVAPPLGYAGAVFLHFLWNTLASLAGGLGSFLVIYVVVWVPLFLAFFATVVWMGYRESRLILRMLAPEVARGLLTKEQAEITASWTRRLAWVGSALLGERSRLGPRRRFLHAASRLALCYWHMERANAEGGMTLSVGQIPLFRKDLEALKAAV